MKKIYITILSVCFVLIFATTSFATTVNDIEPNNSASEAQLIQINNEDPSQIVSGNWTSQQVVIGNLTYVADVPVVSNKILKNSWVFKLDGIVSVSTGYFNLIPKITFKYIYPVLPH